MPIRSETLLVSYDSTNGKDLSCLQISKVENGKLLVTNIYFGEEADNLFKQLENGENNG